MQEQKRHLTQLPTIEQNPEANGARLALAARHHDQPLLYYPHPVINIAESVYYIAQNLSACGRRLVDDDNLGGKKKHEQKFLKHANMMQAICEEIVARTDKEEAAQSETIRELWTLIKQTPPLLADAAGYKLEQLADPALHDGENPFIPLLKQLAESRDGIQNVMKFEPRTKKTYMIVDTSEHKLPNMKLGNYGLVLGGFTTTTLTLGIITGATIASPFSLIPGIGCVISTIATLITCLAGFSKTKLVPEITPIIEEDHLKTYLELVNVMEAKQQR